MTTAPTAPETATQRYFGKYHGIVQLNEDPERRGRILVMVPALSGVFPSTWALPCVPIAGMQAGVFCVPPLKSNVWVEFENGDLDHPIWVGGFWANPGEVPALAQAGLPGSPSIVLQTTGQNTLAISDLPGPTGGILIKSTTGAAIMVNDVGITIQNGKGASIVLAGPSVTVNAGALVVT